MKIIAFQEYKSVSEPGLLFPRDVTTTTWWYQSLKSISVPVLFSPRDANRDASNNSVVMSITTTTQRNPLRITVAMRSTRCPALMLPINSIRGAVLFSKSKCALMPSSVSVISDSIPKGLTSQRAFWCCPILNFKPGIRLSDSQTPTRTLIKIKVQATTCTEF